MGLTKKQKKEIVLMDLEEASEQINKSTNEGIWFRELTAIDNAIKFIETNI